MNAKTAIPPTFTGRHMLMIMIAFFGVIVGVNVTMAVLANTSWTGLVVPNSYVASQHFDKDTAERQAMQALGYGLHIKASPAGISLSLKDKAGKPLALKDATIVLTHIGAGARQAEHALTCAATLCQTAENLVPGLWKGDANLTLADGTAWRQAIELTIGPN